MSFLQKWKEASDRKPLIIRGARQVGKTYLIKEFGRREYKAVAYVNFESNPGLREIFNADFDIRRILLAIQIQTEIPIDPGNTLIVFDEIQEVSRAITSLKYFQENAPEYHIVAAGSLLGVALAGNNSFPVGKVAFLDLYPLSFTEFLEANQDKLLADLIYAADWEMIRTFKSRLIERLKQYYFIGGMPEAVSAFAAAGDFQQVREIHQRILIAYEQDFSKHAPSAIVSRIRMLWNSVPAQLAKENRKFIYGLIREGARAKEYELAMSWLTDCGLIHRVTNVSKPAIPLKAYEEPAVFKIFLVDVGLLTAMVNLDLKTLLEGNALFEEFKGALTEQFVYQQLLTKKDMDIHYWSPGNARAEVDFLLQVSGTILPVEVKAEENLNAKSLRTYCQRYQPKTAVRTSMSDYRRESWMTNVPLYGIEAISKLAQQTSE